ncbi:MAG: hypothetical protein DLM58_06760 [Pseudonocardiales bacterium]|nr:MAG: hypothetical protein DLM58_06760 [Pseudonocardiales bacterium]
MADRSRSVDRSASPSLKTGPARVLIFLYGLFVLAATGRSAFQLAAQFHRAPTAYVLSAVAALVYIAALAALLRRARRIALLTCSIELLGVLAIGTWSYLSPHEFPDATVWSGYGQGYGYLPLLLPILALLWVRASLRTDPPN